MKSKLFALLVGSGSLILVSTSSVALADESSSAVDQKQEQQIQAQFQKTPDLKNNRIEVKVDDGIAVLEGAVDSKQERAEAQRIAHVDGILGVNNRLKVSGTAK